MKGQLYTLEEVIAFIKQGFTISVAGCEELLTKLPLGNWIGGTIPYFMDSDKGKLATDLIFVNKLNTFENPYKIVSYDENDINNIVTDSHDNGYTLLIIPPFQKVHEAYALQAEDLDGIYNNPIVGWIAGTDLNSNDKPKTFNGSTGEVYENKAIAMHVALPEDKFAQIDIINIFDTDENTDEIRFYSDSFKASSCMINGKDTNFAEYILANNIDTKFPLTADYSGASINTSIKEVNQEKGEVSFFAPIFKSKTYHFSKSLDNYVERFENQTKELSEDSEFSCLCILNYVYGELENKTIANFTGPATFGEVAYLLLNQTLVTLNINEI